MELTHFNYIREECVEELPKVTSNKVTTCVTEANGPGKDGTKGKKNEEGKHDEQVTNDSTPTWRWMILFAGVFSNLLQSMVTIANSKMYLQLVERFSMHYTFLVSGSISSYMGVRYLSGKQAFIAFFCLDISPKTSFSHFFD